VEKTNGMETNPFPAVSSNSIKTDNVGPFPFAWSGATLCALNAVLNSKNLSTEICILASPSEVSVQNW